MTDTPDHIKQLHLQIWLSKPPGERLRQFLINNEQLFAFWKASREQLKNVKSSEGAKND